MIIKPVNGTTWDCQERGWWTSGLGSICLEHEGWFFVPAEYSKISSYGPYGTKEEAMGVADSVGCEG